MVQTTFTVPTTQDYASADGQRRFKYFQGDVVPIEVAVDLQMPGAADVAANNAVEVGDQAVVRKGDISTAVGESAGVFLPTRWDEAWKAAKAAAGATPARVAFYGDSFTQGAVSTNFMAKGFTDLVRDALAAKLGYGADAWLGVHNANFYPSFPGTPPFVVNNAAGIATTTGIGFSTIQTWASGAPSPALTFVTPYACTDIDILYSDSVSGSFTYTVDGGAPVTVNTGGTAFVKKIALTGLANTTHTIVFAGVSANGAMRIAAVACYKTKTSGVQVFHAGASNFALGQTRAENWQAWGGKNAGGSWGTIGFPAEPDLLVLDLGVNDLNLTGAGTQKYGPDLVADRLRQIVRHARRARPCSVVIVGVHVPDGVTTDGASYFNWPEAWPSYLRQMHRVAIDQGCAFVNLQARWGETPVAKGFTASNNAHPLDPGHADIAAVLKEILL